MGWDVLNIYMKFDDSWVTNKLYTLVAIIAAFDAWQGQ